MCAGVSAAGSIFINSARYKTAFFYKFKCTLDKRETDEGVGIFEVVSGRKVTNSAIKTATTTPSSKPSGLGSLLGDAAAGGIGGHMPMAWSNSSGVMAASYR